MCLPEMKLQPSETKNHPQGQREIKSFLFQTQRTESNHLRNTARFPNPQGSYCVEQGTQIECRMSCKMRIYKRIDDLWTKRHMRRK